MEQEEKYIKHLNTLHPRKKTAGEEMLSNLRGALIKDLPNAISTAAKNYIINSLSESVKSDDDVNNGGNGGSKKSNKKSNKGGGNSSSGDKEQYDYSYEGPVSDKDLLWQTIGEDWMRGKGFHI